MSSVAEKWWGARHPPAVLGKDILFRDRAVLVTGANSGLGHEAAVDFAARGANPLILGVRTVEKGEQAKTAIIRRTGCSATIFKIETVDLLDFDSVKKFCDRIIEGVPRLHVALLAAGTVALGYSQTSYGFETSTQVNVLSNALMGLLLLPKLKETVASQPQDDPFIPHMTHLGSVAAWEVEQAELPPGQSLIDRINDQSKWNTTRQYFLIKLASYYFFRGLAQRLEEQGVGNQIVVNMADPGFCQTNMILGKVPLIVKPIVLLQYWILGRSAEVGARTLVGATTKGPESNGRLWRNDKYQEASPLMRSTRDKELFHETWTDIVRILQEHVNFQLR